MAPQVLLLARSWTEKVEQEAYAFEQLTAELDPEIVEKLINRRTTYEHCSVCQTQLFMDDMGMKVKPLVEHSHK
jgi:hypothetical protein